MLFKSNKLISLDVGASSIKMVELDVSRDTATLRSFGFAQTPGEAITGGEISDSTAISETIKAIMSEIKTRRKNVAVGIWGSAIIVKKITIPRVEVNLLDEQIKWEAEQYIPFDIKEISLEYHLLKSSAAGDNMDVLLIAAKRGLVYRFVDLVEAAGLSCQIVDVSSFALANCFSFNYGSRTDCVAVINIGSQITNFVVVDVGEVIFSRDIPFGGHNYTTDISRDMGVSLEEAESLKMSLAQAQQVPEELAGIIQGTTEIFVEEIQNSFEFYRATTTRNPITQFYVTGGGIGLPGLVDTISQVTGLNYDVLNPFLKVKFKKSQFSSEYIEQIKPYSAVAIGLALRKVDDT